MIRRRGRTAAPDEISSAWANVQGVGARCACQWHYAQLLRARVLSALVSVLPERLLLQALAPQAIKDERPYTH